MHNIPAVDGAREIDWGKTSADYATWRPDYPAEFYAQLADRGVGLPGQRILDLGTGVGFLARNFASRRADVVGIDIAAGQITEARRCAIREQLDIDFRVGSAEQTGLPDRSFDVITASQCFLYFDKSRVIPEVLRLLRPGGLLVTCHFCWLPREDEIARASENLVLKFNPDWSGADWAGEIPKKPSWADDRFDVVDLLVFDTDIPFTRERWRGRIRACRGIGATLPPDEIEQFDRAHAELLARITGPEFMIRHRIDAHLMRSNT